MVICEKYKTCGYVCQGTKPQPEKYYVPGIYLHRWYCEIERGNYIKYVSITEFQYEMWKKGHK